MTLEKIKKLVQNADICVLATTGAEGPHTSLMTYLSAPDVSELYLVTSTKSLKYKNLEGDPRVSLLVDTREADRRGATRAITITGRAYVITDAIRKSALLADIRRSRPHLDSLLVQPELALIGVRVLAFQLLDGVQDAYFYSIAP